DESKLNYICDVCFPKESTCTPQHILGPRYRCIRCYNFDLCQKCYNTQRQIHFHGTHAFEKIQTQPRIRYALHPTYSKDLASIFHLVFEGRKMEIFSDGEGVRTKRMTSVALVEGEEEMKDRSKT